MMLLEQMVQTGRLTEFIHEFVDIKNEELMEKNIWELWLHKEFEGNPQYPEFRERFNKPANAPEEHEDYETIVKNSQEILNSLSM